MTCTEDLSAPKTLGGNAGDHSGQTPTSEEDPSHPHNNTTIKSVSMDLTLEPSSTTLEPTTTSKYEEEPYIEQVCRTCACSQLMYMLTTAHVHI